jgi:hypothetical protein
MVSTSDVSKLLAEAAAILFDQRIVATVRGSADGIEGNDHTVAPRMVARTQTSVSTPVMIKHSMLQASSHISRCRHQGGALQRQQYRRQSGSAGWWVQ